MNLFPLLVNLQNITVLVVGGGAAAEHVVDVLLHSGAKVELGAPRISRRLAAWSRAGRIHYRKGLFHPDWLDDVWLVVAATSHQAVDTEIAAQACMRRILAYVADNAALSRFQIPAVEEKRCTYGHQIVPADIVDTSMPHAGTYSRSPRPR